MLKHYKKLQIYIDDALFLDFLTFWIFFNIISIITLKCVCQFGFFFFFSCFYIFIVLLVPWSCFISCIAPPPYLVWLISAAPFFSAPCAPWTGFCGFILSVLGGFTFRFLLIINFFILNGFKLKGKETWS